MSHYKMHYAWDVFELHDIFFIFICLKIIFQAFMQNPEFKLIENVF